jgi:hypothetical protein
MDDRQAAYNTLEFILRTREEHPEWFRWMTCSIDDDDRYYVCQQDPETGDMQAGSLSRPFDSYEEAKAEKDRRNGGSLESHMRVQ